MCTIDDQGVPVADERDATCNGYHILEVAGVNLSVIATRALGNRPTVRCGSCLTWRTIVTSEREYETSGRVPISAADSRWTKWRRRGSSSDSVPR